MDEIQRLRKKVDKIDAKKLEIEKLKTEIVERNWKN